MSQSKPLFKQGDTVTVTDGSDRQSAAVVEGERWSFVRSCWTYSLWYPHNPCNVPGLISWDECQLKARS